MPNIFTELFGTVTPEDFLNTEKKNVVIGPDGQPIVLPFKKPGFITRVFNPSIAQGVGAANAAFANAPMLAEREAVAGNAGRAAMTKPVAGLWSGLSDPQRGAVLGLGGSAAARNEGINFAKLMRGNLEPIGTALADKEFTDAQLADAMSRRDYNAFEGNAATLEAQEEVARKKAELDRANFPMRAYSQTQRDINDMQVAGTIEPNELSKRQSVAIGDVNRAVQVERTKDIAANVDEMEANTNVSAARIRSGLVDTGVETLPMQQSIIKKDTANKVFEVSRPPLSESPFYRNEFGRPALRSDYAGMQAQMMAAMQPNANIGKPGPIKFSSGLALDTGETRPAPVVKPTTPTLGTSIQGRVDPTQAQTVVPAVSAPATRPPKIPVGEAVKIIGKDLGSTAIESFDAFGDLGSRMASKYREYIADEQARGNDKDTGVRALNRLLMAPIGSLIYNVVDAFNPESWKEPVRD